MKDISTQMQALDDFVTRARSQNAQHHDSHTKSLQGLSSTVKSSYANIGSHFTSTYERVKDLGDEMSVKTGSLREALVPLEDNLRQPLAELRTNITSTTLQEYQPTGETPQKVQYQYPTYLPRTDAHETLLANLRKPATSASPSKVMVPVVFNDAAGDDEVAFVPSTSESNIRPTGGLREIDINISAGTLSFDSQHGAFGSASSVDSQIPSFKKSLSKMPMSKLNKKASVVTLEGRENAIPGVFSQSTGRRRSPRTG